MGNWLTLVAWVSLVVAALSTLWITYDVMRHPQKMGVMNLVWPITALYSGLLGLWAYLRMGRPSARDAGGSHDPDDEPFWQVAAKAATHCGSGCTLGDLAAEWFVVLVPLTLFGHHIFATWVLDFVLAYLIGIAFQYFTIAPMRNLSLWQGIGAAVKADTLSLAAWQVGMYGWMAIVVFVLAGHEIPKTDPIFWFMMQIAMLVGFATALPVNAWLVRAGIKEKM
jgi:Domain of unknown function (DUF4396)